MYKWLRTPVDIVDTWVHGSTRVQRMNNLLSIAGHPDLTVAGLKQSVLNVRNTALADRKSKIEQANAQRDTLQKARDEAERLARIAYDNGYVQVTGLEAQAKEAANRAKQAEDILAI